MSRNILSTAPVTAMADELFFQLLTVLEAIDARGGADCAELCARRDQLKGAHAAARAELTRWS